MLARLLFAAIFVSTLQVRNLSAIAANCFINSNTKEQPESSGEGARDTNLPVHMVGYEGIDPTLWARDLVRVNKILRSNDGPTTWPNRDVFTPVSLENFPYSAGPLTPKTEPVPVYVLVDPDEIDRAWKASPQYDDSNNAPDKHRFPVLDGPATACEVATFAPTIIESELTVSYRPWPSWADSALANYEERIRRTTISNNRWSALSTNYLCFTNGLIQMLHRLGISYRSFSAFGVSPSVARIVMRYEVPMPPKQIPRGELVFALWESTGLLREDENDPWKNGRNGPMSSHVRSPDFDWRVNGRTSFVMAAPFADLKAPRREYVILPESISKLKVPIISVYSDRSSKPLAEDYVFKVGPPTTTVDLQAICLFTTCTDEQIRSIPAALRAAEIRNSPPPQAPAPPPPASP